MQLCLNLEAKLRRLLPTELLNYEWSELLGAGQPLPRSPFALYTLYRAGTKYWGGHLYSGLSYPVAIALVTVIFALFFVPETRARDIYSGD